MNPSCSWNKRKEENKLPSLRRGELMDKHTLSPGPVWVEPQAKKMGHLFEYGEKDILPPSGMLNRYLQVEPEPM